MSVRQSDEPGTTPDRAGLNTYTLKLAQDRTTLAWIRTTLAMASFGFGMVAFFRTLRETHPYSAEAIRMHDGAVKMGMAFLALAVVATVLAGVSHRHVLSRLREGTVPVVTHWPLAITVTVLVTGISLAGLAYVLLR